MHIQINDSFVISLGFADYLRTRSGMPKVIMEHQKMYNKAGISYIYLFSVKKKIMKDNVMLFCKFGVIIDGQFRGIYQMNQILQFLGKWIAGGKKPLDFHIHHLLYMNLHRVEELFDFLQEIPKKVFLHDYYNACTNYNLRYSGGDYCGGNGLSIKYCSGCANYKKSVQVQKKLHNLYRKYFTKLTFVSPSEITKEIFLRFHPEYEENTIVIPHQKPNGVCRENLEYILPDEKLRIAFLGMPATHKGWDAWKTLVDTADHDQYEFFLFNSAGIDYSGMVVVPVSYSEKNLEAMTKALREKKIHIALLWATWPETYSYTCFEAYAANAFLITGKNSGNVAKVVEKEQIGLVLEDISQLQMLFQDSQGLKKLLNEFREETSGGPLQLQPNADIVELTVAAGNPTFVKSKKIKRKPINYPLLWLLRWLYQRIK